MSIEGKGRHIPNEVGRKEAESFEKTVGRIIKDHPEKKPSPIFPNKSHVTIAHATGEKIFLIAPDKNNSGSTQDTDTEVKVKHTYPDEPEGTYTLFTIETFSSDVQRRDNETAKKILEGSDKDASPDQTANTETPWIYYRKGEEIHTATGKVFSEQEKLLRSGDLESMLEAFTMKQQEKQSAEALGLHYLLPEKYPQLMEMLDEIDSSD